MKKLYVLAGALFAASGAFAQGHELFFSAYNEGAHGSNSTPPGGGAVSAGNEKAIQIFNPTTATVDMGQYSIARYSNGSNVPTEEEELERNKPTTGNNNLTSSDVFVYGAVDATLLEITNVWDQQAAAYTSTAPTVLLKGGAAAWNGNDAVALRRWTGGAAGVGTPVIVDIFGVIGHDPGTPGWLGTTVVNGVVETVRSANMSLNRKGSVENGTRVNPNSATYNIGDEWEPYSAWPSNDPTPTGWYAQSYANLAGHAAIYDGTYGAYLPLGILDDFNKAISVYPNPANQQVKIKIENKKVSSITILNGLGQTIKVNPINAAQKEMSVDISSLKPGLYFVKFVSGDEYKTTIFKELIVQ